MFQTFKSMLRGGAVAAASMLFVGGVHAGIIPSLDTVAEETQGYRWTYDAELSPAARADNGDFFTIYDFRGFVPGTNQQPEGWIFVAQPVGLTPDRVLPNDDPGIMNLTWIRQGGTIGTETQPVDLGQFSAVSRLNQPILDDFTSRTTRAVGFATNTPIHTIGSVAVPIPLPAAALAFPFGALAAGLVYRRVRKNGL